MIPLHRAFSDTLPIGHNRSGPHGIFFDFQRASSIEDASHLFLTLWRHLRVIAAVTWKHSLVPTWDGKKICLHELERVYHRGNSMFVDGYVSRLLIWLITFMSAVSVPASRLPLFMSENWFHPKPDNVNFQPTAVFVVGKLADGRGHVKKTGARL